jgi:hypothetical protein
MLVTNIKHGGGLIDADDPSSFQALRHRPSHSPGTRRHVENLFIALQNKHFSQFFGEISADLRGTAIELRCVLRVMKMSFVAMAMFVTVLVLMLMAMSVFVIVCVMMPVLVFLLVRIAMGSMTVAMVVPMIAFIFVFFVLRVMFPFHFFAIPSKISH